MNWINFIAAVTMLILIMGYIKNIQYANYLNKTTQIELYGYLPVFLLIGFAFTIRVLLAGMFEGHKTDINCFLSWSDMLVKNGFSNFYSKEVFTDYPPGYMYFLYLIGWIRNLFQFDYFSTPSIILLKLPAIICDMITGYLIFQIASKKLNKISSYTCMLMYILNPAIFINSSIWGQVDSVFTLAVVYMCFFIINKQLPKAYFAFAIGILIKPQTLIFTPVLMIAIFDSVFRDGVQIKQFLFQLKWGLLSILFMVVSIIPFGWENVIQQYKDTLSSYPFASINAYNIWTMFGLNWSSQDNKFLIFTYAQWGTMFIIIIVGLSMYIGIRIKNDLSKYTLIAALLVSSVFLFSVRMHERYLFPFLALVILTFVLRPKKEMYFIYILFSIIHFYNVAYVLFIYDYQNFSPYDRLPIVISVAAMLAFCIFLFVILKSYIRESEDDTLLLVSTEITEEKDKNSMEDQIHIQPSEVIEKINKKDIIAILIITIVYSFIAFYDLGDRVVPNTFWVSNERNDEIILDFGGVTNIKQISYYNGNYERRDFTISTAEDAMGPWTYLSEIRLDPVFYWGKEDVITTTRYLKLTSDCDKSAILELIIIDQDNNVVLPINYQEYPTLFDEQELFPERTTFRNSTYFDEIYHARTAYEYLHGLYSYENTHPPLGKIFISLGMIVFGVNPFGWRIAGTLFGIAMLPFIYAFSKRFFKETWIAILTTILFSFDFMHFTQTRIATIDVFVTFFIILMYYFMYMYTRLNFYDTKLSKTFIPLGLCGISMGLGIASKWTGVYAGAGLAIIFFWHIIKRYKEYHFAKQDPEGISGEILHEDVIKTFRSKVLMTLGFCIIFFILIPSIIYLLSYLPVVDGQGRDLIPRLLKNQESMLKYHASVDATHPYSSWWYQWPTMYRPIWYYSGHLNNKISEGISAFGNPLVWWTGIPAFFYMIYLGWKKKDKKAVYLVIAYLTQYIPWIFVTRITFIYHYFPSVPFVTLMVGYSMYQIVANNPRRKKFAVGYTIVAIGLFIMFYPVLSGQPVNKDYVSMFLRWFDSWVLVS